MRVLILWADDRSDNLGVRALAQGSRALVHRVWPDADVTFQSFGQRIPQLPIGTFRSLVRERVTGARGTRAWFADFDLVIDSRAGDSFADIYGARRLRLMSAVAEFATEAGTPVVLGPQTIGPFATLEGRTIARFSMRRAAAVMARDTESARFAASLGRPVDTVTTDVVFAIPVPDVPKTRDVVFNVSGLLWQPNPHVDHLAYRDVVTRVHQGLLDAGRQVSLLAHVIDSPVPDNDVPSIRDYVATTGTDAEVIVPSSLEEVRAAVASSALTIGSRMHACLNALSVGTPAIPLAYSRKFAPLLRDLGWTRSVDLRSDPDPVSAVLEHASADGLDDEVAVLRATAATSLVAAETVLRNVPLSGRAAR